MSIITIPGATPEQNQMAESLLIAGLFVLSESDGDGSSRLLQHQLTPIASIINSQLEDCIIELSKELSKQPRNLELIVDMKNLLELEPLILSIIDQSEDY